MRKTLRILKKILIPFLIFVPVSIIVALLLAEKIIRYAQPQLSQSQAEKVSLAVSHKSDYLPSDLKPNYSTTHMATLTSFLTQSA